MDKHESLKQWVQNDRPREKLLELGRRALSEVELLAVLIGTGSLDEPVMNLCRRMMVDAKNDLHVLANYSVLDFCAYNGMGKAKAMRVVAALELGRRRDKLPPKPRPVLNYSKKVYTYFKHVFRDLKHEESWAIYLDTGCRLIQQDKIGSGGLTYTPTETRKIIRIGLECHAHSIILMHNHPSDTLKPSKSDVYLTDRLMAACALFEIELQDHIIFGDSGFYSFRDEGMIN